jgi:hypothetical protein
MDGRGASWLWPSNGLGDPSLRWIQGEITWKRKDPNETVEKVGAKM